MITALLSPTKLTNRTKWKFGKFTITKDTEREDGKMKTREEIQARLSENSSKIDDVREALKEAKEKEGSAARRFGSSKRIARGS